MTTARSVTAHFTRTYTLTTAASPSGGGTVSGGGTHDSGTDATVTATANSGYRFDRWSGACTGTGTCSVTMNANRSVTAHFIARYALTTSASPSGGGTVSGGGTYGLRERMPRSRPRRTAATASAAGRVPARAWAPAR